MEAPRGVHDQNIRVAGAGRLSGIVHDRGGICARVVPHKIDPDPLRPHLQLVDRRRAKCVARREQDLLLLAFQPGRQFTDRGRLSRTVGAENDHHSRRRSQREGRRLTELAGQDLHERPPQGVWGSGIRPRPLAEARDHGLGAGDAEISLNEEFL